MISNRSRLYLSLALVVPLATWSYQRYSLHNYVLCSKSHNIYTVDDSAPNVPCISVRNTRIVALGALGKHPSLCITFFFVSDALYKMTLWTNVSRHYQHFLYTLGSLLS